MSTRRVLLNTPRDLYLRRPFTHDPLTFAFTLHFFRVTQVKERGRSGGRRGDGCDGAVEGISEALAGEGPSPPPARRLPPRFANVDRELGAWGTPPAPPTRTERRTDRSDHPYQPLRLHLRRPP